MADELELIFLNIDPAYNISLHALLELNKQERLDVTNVQQCRLNEGIQSDDEDEVNKYKFGGNTTGKKPVSAFGQTASSVMRMVMLRAVGVADKRSNLPNMRPISGRRNWEASPAGVEVLDPINGKKFCLANVADSHRYWTKYDQLNPQSTIREKLWKADIGEQVKFDNMMLIFRNNFREVIEITTTAHATKGTSEGHIVSYVHVFCIRREISDGDDGPQFSLMKNSFGYREGHLNGAYFGQHAKNDNETDDDWHKRLNDGLVNLAIK